ncbi:hypothetical protein HanXRQr2_Chr13g0610221 [Helianthus annuus]|uniref:Uncharacterized protein n=1 Tax=Helianthus annuus TaxID=4232 RepID=A0A9K3ELM0_HELAN|nr:hypothetical protein HanXRQr2_Chr13g0610221 [Helianthus annuus]KAJ0483204.1 hypothetical protein HanIR_Chr13g0662341 [Helianthus annuus]KAJ0499335.1 hypothetical protein HanHA89_Chr13g0532971 [Helianthus annuus]KAJ0665355.1 hypothetical protein HanLR1_Chr13g0503061 [Helianthus annuus]
MESLLIGQNKRDNSSYLLFFFCYASLLENFYCLLFFLKIGKLQRSTTGGYGGSRSLMFGQDAHGSYSSSRQGMSYGAGSYRYSDGVNIYSSSYYGHYISRGGDVGESS